MKDNRVHFIAESLERGIKAPADAEVSDTLIAVIFRRLKKKENSEILSNEIK